MDIKERILKCLDYLGISVSTEGESSNILLEDIITDSIMFISFIADLEEEFNLEITDDYLYQGSLSSLQDAENMVQEIIQDNANKISVEN